MHKARLLAYLLRYFGIGWLIYRGTRAFACRMGLLALPERFLDSSAARVSSALAAAGFATAESYADYRRHKAPAFFFGSRDQPEYDALLSRWDRNGAGPSAVVDQIKSGTFTYFAHTAMPVGYPPDWHRNPFTNISSPADLHWSRIDEASLGDIKVIWELSRFAFAYPLVRHYWRSGDEQSAELFWQLVEDWDRSNPTCRGVNWRCSQEIAIRVMAWCFGLYGFANAKATSAARIATLARMIWASGHRISLDLPDAIRQKNNHGISAAAGLFTIGALFPEFEESRRWVDEGRRVLERLGRELIYDDGAFAQHSLNYHRLMLHDYLWAIRLGQLTGVGFSEELHTRVRRSAELLWQLQDETTGAVPQYGQFDGALILPLDNCDFLDFRPVTQAAGFLLDGRRWWTEGPHDEDLLWMFGPRALEASVRPPERQSVAAPDGGYYTLRGVETFVMTRCARFRHRPGQPDMLHVDVWWRGHNVATDAGTFSYGDGGPVWQELIRTPAHNTVGVDGADQMERFGKFLWFPWLNGRVLHGAHPDRGPAVYWEGEHDGYARFGVRHRRGIMQVAPSAWLVVDRLEALQPHAYRLHWLLPDGPFTWDSTAMKVSLPFSQGEYAIQVVAPGARASGEVQRASADGTGWRSKYYYSREPAPSFSVSVEARTQTFATLLAPMPAVLRLDPEDLQIIVGDRTVRVALSRSGAGPLASLLPRHDAIREEREVHSCT